MSLYWCPSCQGNVSVARTRVRVGEKVVEETVCSACGLSLERKMWPWVLMADGEVEERAMELIQWTGSQKG